MIDATPPISQEKIAAPSVPDFRMRLARHPHWLAMAFYIGLSLVITFPLIFQMGTHLHGSGAYGDSYQNMWYMWWYGRALEQGLDPSRSNLMYALLPDVQVLISSVLNGVLMWPFVRLFGAVAAFNLAVLISFPLAGFWTYRLADFLLEGRSRGAAFAAGFFFAFSTYHLSRTEGHLGLVTVQWLPFYLWRLMALQRRPGWPNALWLGLGLALAGLSDLYYLGYFVFPVTVFALVWFATVERRTFWRWPTPGYFGLAFGVGLALMTPFYSFFLKLDADVSQSVSYLSNDVRDFSADLLAFLLPDPQNPFFGGLTAPVYANFKSFYLIEEAIFPGYLLILLGLVAPWLPRVRNRVVFFLAGLIATGFVLALGPRLHIAGNEIGPNLPYAYIYGKLPLLPTFRAPSRISLVVQLGLALMAAFSLTWMLSRLKRPLWGWLLLGGVMVVALVESLVFSPPLPTDPIVIPQAYREIAAESGDFKVLELPLDSRSQSLFYQIFHQKRLIGGEATRSSNRMSLSWDQATYLGMFNTAESSAVINNGQVLNAPGGSEIFPLDLTFRQMLVESKIGYVTVRTSRKAFAWIEDYVVRQLGPPTSQEVVKGERLLVWRLLPLATYTPPPVAAGNYRIRLGEGWNAGLGKSDDGRLLRLVSQDGQLQVTPGTPGPTNLSLQVTPYIRPQTIEVRLNGQPVGRIEGKEPWKPFTARFALNLPPGQNLIELHSVEGCLHPVDYIPNSPDFRCISFAVQDVRIGG